MTKKEYARIKRAFITILNCNKRLNNDSKKSLIIDLEYAFSVGSECNEFTIDELQRLEDELYYKIEKGEI